MERWVTPPRRVPHLPGVPHLHVNRPLSNRVLFRVYIASSKHGEGWENSTQLVMQTRDLLEVGIVKALSL